MHLLAEPVLAGRVNIILVYVPNECIRSTFGVTKATVKL